MTTTPTAEPSPPVTSAGRGIATEPTTSRAWWFLGTLAVLRNPEGTPRTPAVIELTIAPGGSPPRHVHDALDDAFLLLEGEVVLRCGEDTVVARPGTYAVLPHGVEHTFRVTSREPAKMLLVHGDDSFLRFIEAVGTPTTDLRLPPAGEQDLDVDTLVRISADHGAPIVGPSLDEDEARAAVDVHRPAAALGPVHHVALDVTHLRRSEQWYVHAFGLLRVDGAVADDGAGHVLLASPTAPYGSGFVVRDPDGLEVELFAPAPDRT